jgi:hypothetical protein
LGENTKNAKNTNAVNTHTSTSDTIANILTSEVAYSILPSTEVPIKEPLRSQTEKEVFLGVGIVPSKPTTERKGVPLLGEVRTKKEPPYEVLILHLCLGFTREMGVLYVVIPEVRLFWKVKG